MIYACSGISALSFWIKDTDSDSVLGVVVCRMLYQQSCVPCAHGWPSSCDICSQASTHTYTLLYVSWDCRPPDYSKIPASRGRMREERGDHRRWIKWQASESKRPQLPDQPTWFPNSSRVSMPDVIIPRPSTLSITCKSGGWQQLTFKVKCNNRHLSLILKFFSETPQSLL